MRWKYVSQQDLTKGLKTAIFGGPSKFLVKSFSKPFEKSKNISLKTFHEVGKLFDQSENSVNCDYYIYSI